MREIKGGKARFDLFGPFSFDRSQAETHKEALQQFWANRAVDSEQGLNEAVGVYVWTSEEEGKSLPWNVGRTSRQGFEARFRQKASTFPLNVMNAKVYLLALRTSTKAGFRKPTRTKAIGSINWLEKTLIESAIRVNPKLMNTASSKYFRNVVVQGFLNDSDEPRTKSVDSFAKVFEPKARKRK